MRGRARLLSTMRQLWPSAPPATRAPSQLRVPRPACTAPWRAGPPPLHPGRAAPSRPFCPSAHASTSLKTVINQGDGEGEQEEDLESEDSGYEGAEDGVTEADSFETWDDEELSPEDFPEDEEGFPEDEDGFGAFGTDEPGINLGNATWGADALSVVRKTLAGQGFEELELYSFYANGTRKSIAVSLDKPADVPYGSASSEDTERFARALVAGLEAALGEELAGAIDTEVSSTGAERGVKIPSELERFRTIPLRVRYREGDPGAHKERDEVLQLETLDLAGGTSVWALADVKQNRGDPKRTRLTKKLAARRTEIALDDLLRVNIHLEL